MTLAEASRHLPVAFFAVSHAIGSVPPPGGPSERRLQAATCGLFGADSRLPSLRSSSIWIAAEPGGSRIEPNGSFTVLLSRMSYGVVQVDDLGRQLTSMAQEAPKLGPAATQTISNLTPPFAVVACRGDGYPVVAATDYLGYRHVYYYQGHGRAAASTSSIALARCTGTGLDHDSLAARSLLGFHLGESTPFSGVQKLGPGGICALANGKVSLGEYCRDDSLANKSGEGLPAKLVREVATLLRETACD